jgi:N,N-dimethylformamidase
MTSLSSPWRKRILGYSNKLTVRPGEHIEFKISVEGDSVYDAQLVQLINGDIYSDAANFKEIEIASPLNKRYQGREQPVAPGSCVVVEDARRLDSLSEFTIVLGVMPTVPANATQHLVSLWDDRTGSGWSLHINDKGALAFMAASPQGGVASTAIDQPLTARTWYTAILRVSWKNRTARLDCRAIGSVFRYENDLMDKRSCTEDLGERPRISCPLLMAAAFGGRDAGGRVVPAGCFNGRLESPVIYQRVLSDNELGEVVAGERPSSLTPQLIADWDFSDNISGARITDRSGNGLDGCTHNLPLRGVKGTRWNGSTMEWRHAPEQYGAIHFHSDDIHDCGWQTDIRYEIPANMGSGIYALRLRRGEEPQSVSCEEYLPFFVAAPRSAPQAKVAFLAPTYTYTAYANNRFCEPFRKATGLPKRKFYAPSMLGPGTMEYAMLAEEHREFGRSLYDLHMDGSPVHFSSWLRPLLNVRPKSILWGLCADLLLIDWLHAKRFDHDVITDDLLQEEGVDLLSGYTVVMTGNHPEYLTTEQLNAIESYIDRGGRVMYMGGNGFYWRTAVANSAIEVRRGRTGTGMWQSAAGESCLALSGEPGGIWRDLDRPPQRLTGVGFIAQGPGASYYRILPEARRSSAAFIFEGVEDDVIGDFGIFGGGAAGQEIDKTNGSYGTPSQTTVLARSENHGLMVYVIEEMSSSNPGTEAYRSQTCAEVTFFETKNGGAVFSVGSMAWCGSLSHNGYDNNISTVTANVLKRLANV